MAIAALVALAYNTTVWALPYGLIAFLSVTYIHTYNFDTVLRDLYMPRAKALGNYRWSYNERRYIDNGTDSLPPSFISIKR